MSNIIKTIWIFILNVFAKGTKEQPIIELNEKPTYISPNNDNVKDSDALKVKMTLYLRSENGYIPRYGLSIVSPDEKIVKEVKGEEKRDLKLHEQWSREFEPFTMEREIFWDGKDQYGKIVKDGVYEVRGWVIDSSRNKISTKIGDFIVDVEAPSVTFKERVKKVFSPNGDDRYESFIIEQESSKEALWEASIINSDGEVVRKENFVDTSLENYIWDGKSDNGEVVPNGIYTYQVVSTDEAGNGSSKNFYKNIEVVVQSTNVVVSPEFKGFSPNDDGVRDTLTMNIDYEYPDRIVAWEYVVKASNSEKVIYSVTGDKDAPTSVILSGETPTGDKLEEGFYDFMFNCIYDFGNKPTSIASFAIDNTPPKVGLDSKNNPFYQTQDGEVKGDYFISIDAKDNFSFDGWDLEIKNSDGDVVKVFAGEGNPSEFVSWNGNTDDSSTKIPETFEMLIKVTDIGGNVAYFTRPVKLDVFVVEKNGKYYLMVPNIIFDAYKSALDSKGEDTYNKNIASIEKVLDIYNKYPGYRIVLEAHSLNIYEKDSDKYEKEEEILIPITEDRADVVADKLVEIGMDPIMIKKEAFGSKNPIASPFDKEERWKNRRVEFVMELDVPEEPKEQEIEVEVIEDTNPPEDDGDLF